MNESPVSILKEAKTFSNIIKELLDGAKIHKLEWKDKEFYGFMKDGKLTLHKPDGKDYDWILNDGDLSGSDYIII
jgi:DNA polymerase III sliding clamp (beta) subunit (PCNA family)